MVLPHNHHPHSRYVLKEAPWGYQASDLIHRDISGPVFDLGVDLDDSHGIAYIRVTDVEEMARVLGMATKDEVTILKNRIAELNAEVMNVPREVESLKDGLDALVSDFLDRVVPRNDGTGDTELSASEEESQGQLELPIDGNGEPDETSGQVDSDAIDKGPDELSGGPSDEFGFDTIKRSKR